MAANIEINEGVASFAENGRRARAWHKLGQVFDRPMTVREALEASHADYRVELADIAFISPAIIKAVSDNGSIPTDTFLDSIIKGKKATVRTDTYKPLGIVSDSYGIVQNLDAFTFIDTLCTGQVGDHAPVIECAGVLGHGERIFITAKFQEDIILGNKGDDKVEMYMVFTTSHDGTGSVKCVCTPIRTVCENTLRAALAHNCGCLSLRHSSNIMQRLDLTSKENTEFAFKALNLMSVYKKSLEQRFDHLRNIRISEQDLDRILAEVVLSEKSLELYKKSGSIEHDDIPTQSKNAFSAMKHAVEYGVGQDMGERGTGLWVVNGITSYYQNNASFRSEEVKFDSILNGYTAKKVLDACVAVEDCA